MLGGDELCSNRPISCSLAGVAPPTAPPVINLGKSRALASELWRFCLLCERGATHVTVFAFPLPSLNRLALQPTTRRDLTSNLQLSTTIHHNNQITTLCNP